MSEYVKSTNFTSKDSLPQGNPLKIVKGTEIDAEFNNIAIAMATKADLISPIFVGTPTAPTAAYGTNTTQLATTAFVTAALQLIYPVGSIYTNASSATNPSTLIGFGTWSAFGSGRVLVGLNGGDASFDALGETGGSKDTTLPSHTHYNTATGTTGNQSADHTHNASSTVSDPSHGHLVGSRDSTAGNGGSYEQEFISAVGSYGPNVATSASVTGITVSTSNSGVTANHTHSVNVSGTTDASGVNPTNTNLQPYVVVNMWLRTA